MEFHGNTWLFTQMHMDDTDDVSVATGNLTWSLKYWVPSDTSVKRSSDGYRNEIASATTAVSYNCDFFNFIDGAEFTWERKTLRRS